MKRKNDMKDINLVIHKKSNTIDWNTMISASSIKNYMLDDPLIDWLKYYNITDINSSPIPSDHNNYNHNHNHMADLHTKFIMGQGIEFENYVINLLKQTKPHIEIKQISFKNETQSIDHHNMTIDAMEKGIPIIYQGVIHCRTKSLYGSPDLLIRHDMMNEIFNITDEKIKPPQLNNNICKYHYVVMDIKHSTITLNCNQEYILNTNCIPAYKGQIYIYNMILESIQGYVPRCGFILGKNIMYTKNKNTFVSSVVMKNIARIDYTNNDKRFINKVHSAIKWIHTVRTEGHSWHLLPSPSRVELYPNMKNDKDGLFRKIKYTISNKLGEITNIWWCGYEKRIMAHHKKIYNWKDKRLNAEVMGFNNTKIATTIDMILDINRQNTELIRLTDLKKCIDKCWLNFGDDIIEFYIDFETIAHNIGQVVQNNLSDDYIFMIGLGWVENNIWQFKNFIIEKLNNNCEHNMMKDMWIFIKNKITEMNCTNCVFIHWTNAEVVFYDKFKIKEINKDMPNMIFYDMHKLFLNNKVVVHGALNFSLKTIGNAMYENKMISTSWDSNSICSNGLQAMFLAYEQYKNNDITSNTIMDKIAHYNHVDCKIMWEIMKYIRNAM